MTAALEPHLVRIDNPLGRPIGVGCLLDGNVVATCAHVVATALGDDGLAFGDKPSGQVSLRFPYSDSKSQVFQGTVIGWHRRVDFDALPDSGLADIAFLSIEEDLPRDVAPASVTEDKNLAPRDFEAFGYPAGMSMGDGTAGRVTRRLPCDWYRLDKTNDIMGRRIEPGFSGGPVLLTGSPLIGGLIVAHDLDRNLGGGLMISGFVLAQAWRQLSGKGGFAGPVAAPAETLGRVHDAPGIPANYVERPDVKGVLRALLLRPGSGGIGLYGMGGIGKSVLVASILEDSAIRRAFADGLYWLGVGRDAVPERLQAQLYQRVTGRSLAARDLAEGRNALAAALADKKMLIVLDDVWAETIIAAFPSGPDQPRLLIATRLADIIEAARAEVVTVQTMTEAEAAGLLQHHAGEAWPKGGIADPIIADILEETGGLPLALALSGTQARESRGRWADVLQRLRGARLDLVRGRLRDYPTYETVFKSLDASVAALGEAEQDHYRDLAIFAEDRPIPMKVLEILWGAEDRLEAWEHANLFTRRALASWTVEGDLALHGLQHDYIRATAADLPARHRRLVAGYHAACDGRFDRSENDGYVFELLLRHVKSAGMTAELASLLVDFDWLAAKLAATASPVGLWRDLAELGSDPAHHAVEQALRHAAPALVKAPGLLAQQLCGRLDPGQSPILSRLLDQARTKAPIPALLPLRPCLRERSFALLHSFEGHRGGILAVALTGDGKSCLSAGDDHTLKLWDLESGRLRHDFEGHSGWVRAVALTADHKHALSASDDRSVKLWEIETGRLCCSFEGHRGGVNALVLTLDGLKVLSASDDRSLRLWDIETGRLCHSLDGHCGSVMAVTISADGKRAISAATDCTLLLWDLATGRSLRCFEGHEDTIVAVAMTPDGKRCVSASDDGTLKIWEIATGRILHSLAGHTRRINALALTPDGRRVISAASDRTLKLWDIETGRLRHSLEGHGGRVNAVTVTPDGKRALSASSDDTLRLWDLANGALLHSFEGHTGWVLAAALTADGKRAVSAARDRTLKLWDIATGTARACGDFHGGRVNAIALTRDGRRAISASDDETLMIWDGTTGTALHCLEGHTAWVNAVALSPDGKGAVSGGFAGTVKHWDLATGALRRSLFGHEGGITAVALTADGRFALTGSADHTLRFWDLETGLPHCCLEGHGAGIRAVAMAGDGRFCVSGDDEGILKIWDLVTGVLCHTLDGHKGGVSAVALTLDGSIAVSAARDQVLKIWDVETGRLRHTLEGHSDWVRAVVLTEDGKRAISAGDDGSVRVWEIETGRLSHNWEGHTGEIRALALTGDDNRVVTASRDRAIRVWDIEEGVLVAELIGSAEMICVAMQDGLVVGGDALGRVHIAALVETRLDLSEG